MPVGMATGVVPWKPEAFISLDKEMKAFLFSLKIPSRGFKEFTAEKGC